MAGELNIIDDNFERELLANPAPLAFIDFEAFMPSNYIIPGTMINDKVPCQWSCHTLPSHGLDWSGLQHSEFLWTGDAGWSPIYAFVQSLYYATQNAATILIYSPYEAQCLDACIQLASNDMAQYQSGSITPDYVVVDMYGNKVPLMSIAPQIAGWCNSMKSRFYDMCPRSASVGGVKKWIQSPVIGTSNSIKDVFPAAMEEYSRSAELLSWQGEPANGYPGLRATYGIADGGTCTNTYSAALNRPPRPGVPLSEPGNAPFDPSVEAACLIYCKLDTLSMVVIYLAVLEATQRWRELSKNVFATYARFPDGTMHYMLADADAGLVYKDCDYSQGYPYESVELVTQYTLQSMPVTEMYQALCPTCRRAHGEEKMGYFI